MGQKVNPHGLRVGIIKDWDSKWYADKDYEKFLLEDIKIREFIKEKLFLSGISKDWKRYPTAAYPYGQHRNEGGQRSRTPLRHEDTGSSGRLYPRIHDNHP